MTAHTQCLDNVGTNVTFNLKYMTQLSILKYRIVAPRNFLSSCENYGSLRMTSIVLNFQDRQD